jgi:hypothetical protein
MIRGRDGYRPRGLVTAALSDSKNDDNPDCVDLEIWDGRRTRMAVRLNLAEAAKLAEVLGCAEFYKAVRKHSNAR